MKMKKKSIWANPHWLVGKGLFYPDHNIDYWCPAELAKRLAIARAINQETGGWNLELSHTSRN